MDISINTERVAEVKEKASKVVMSCHILFQEMSDAVVGTIADMYPPEDQKSDPDRPVRVILKNNRHMYIALTLILLLTIYTIFFRS